MTKSPWRWKGNSKRPAFRALICLLVVSLACLFLSQRTYQGREYQVRRESSVLLPEHQKGTHLTFEGKGKALRLKEEQPDQVIPAGGKEEQTKETEKTLESMGLHYEFLKKGIDAHAVRTLPLNFGKSSSQPLRYWNSCAVVGNSGSVLLGRQHGLSIDAHDVVIRLNFAPLASHQEDVGSKTQVAFINGWKLEECSNDGQNCNCWNYYKERRDVHVVAYAILEEHVTTARACGDANTKFYLVEEDFKQFCNRLVHHYTSERIKRNFPVEMWPMLAEERRKVKLHSSSGFQAVVFALALCSSVSLYGFGKLEDKSSEDHPQHHYFENKTVEEIADHDYEAEMIFYREFEKHTEKLSSILPFRAKTFKLFTHDGEI